MNVGYTGPEEGMTPEQQKRLRGLLRSWMMLTPDEEHVFHHGDCIGGDEEADGIARREGWMIEVWPPDNSAKRAFVRLGPALKAVHNPKPYLDRDWDIAAQDILVATSKQDSEPEGRERGGTWATVTRARKQSTPVRIIWPDGSETVEENQARLEGT